MAIEKLDANEAVYERLLDELELQSLITGRFWGSIEVQFQNGHPITIKKIETKKVSGNNPNANAR
jgi:hypothetical protein